MQLHEAVSLSEDCVAVVRVPGPKSLRDALQLHKSTPYLINLQDQGYKVALLLWFRMSGRIRLKCQRNTFTPEAVSGGLIAKPQKTVT